MKEIERTEFNIDLAISLFLKGLESECLPIFIKIVESGVSRRDKIPSIQR